jgi:hypothetical protein
MFADIDGGRVTPVVVLYGSSDCRMAPCSWGYRPVSSDETAGNVHGAGVTASTPVSELRKGAVSASITSARNASTATQTTC